MSDVFRKEYKPLTDEQKDAMGRIKDKAEELMASFEDIQSVLADGRQMALAKTNLEQSVMWAIKSLT